MLVRHAMTTPVVTTSPKATLREVAALLLEHDIRHLPVVDPRDRLLGVISNLDVERARGEEDFPHRRCEAIMSTDPLTVGEEDLFEDALLQIQENHLDSLPVVDSSGSIRGILTRADCLRVMVGLLGLAEPGSRLALRIAQPEKELALALSALERSGSKLISLLLSADLQPVARRLYLRLQDRDPKHAVEQLRQAGLVVLQHK